MNSKTRMGPNSELSSRAPLARFSRDKDEPRTPQPLRSRPQARITTEHARKKFGRKIQALRKQAGLTHEDLSKECGTTITKLKMIECGEAEPRLFTIIGLAERLQTTAEDLLKEIE
ncbi:MAG TPA: helix-turn-helix transcriptional regulator [Candidatus Angelobacter sp.]